MNAFLLFGAAAALIIAVGVYITRGTSTQDNDRSGASGPPDHSRDDDATVQR